MTCCALHNWLLEVDGLADGWENGVKSYWETEPDDPCDVPFAIKRLRQESFCGNTYNRLIRIGKGK